MDETQALTADQTLAALCKLWDTQSHRPKNTQAFAAIMLEVHKVYVKEVLVDADYLAELKAIAAGVERANNIPVKAGPKPKNGRRKKTPADDPKPRSTAEDEPTVTDAMKAPGIPKTDQPPPMPTKAS